MKNINFQKYFLNNCLFGVKKKFREGRKLREFTVIVKSCLNLLKCINLSENDSLKYMKEGPLITCFEGIHIIYITSISLIGFLFCGLCFHIGLIYILATSVKTTMKFDENIIKSNKISPVSCKLCFYFIFFSLIIKVFFLFK